MADRMFTIAKSMLAKKELDLENDDLRVALLMSNTDVLNKLDADVLTEITLDECDGAAYARVALAGKAVVRFQPNKVKWKANAVEFTTLGVGTRDNVGALMYLHVGADAVNVPVLWRDEAPEFPSNGNGADFTLRWHETGLFYF